MKKSRILFVAWLIGVVMILASVDHDIYTLFILLAGAVIGAGAVVFLLDYIESR